MDRRRIIIDCDPGVDDAVMLLFAGAARDALDIVGITTVAGNVSAALTARNACIVRALAAREDIPVYAGCTQPLQRTPVEAGHFHGSSGLGDLPITAPRHGPEARHAIDFIVETLLAAAPGSVTLVATGPLTNVATALAREPAIRRGLREIAIMGGARSEGGNITASAEYNIHADPDAAQAVFGSGCTVVAFGLDATHQVRATPARVDAVRAVGSRAALAAVDLLEFSNALPANGPREQGAPLHDPCPIAWLLRPEAFKFRPCHVDVETRSTLTLGHTAVEFRAAPQRPQNVLWAVSADGDAVFELLTATLAHAAQAADPADQSAGSP
jgi:purine nucleosidase